MASYIQIAVSSEISENQIDTFPVDDILEETDLQQVLEEIDFVCHSDSFGIDTYIRTLELVENILCTEEQWFQLHACLVF